MARWQEFLGPMRIYRIVLWQWDMKLVLESLFVVAALACSASAHANDASINSNSNSVPSFTLLLEGEAGGIPSFAVEFDDSANGLTDSNSERVINLPSAPDSMALVFSAMLSLGAWQVYRHPPHLHLTPMPEWYHTGGPAQVGHATPLNLDFDSLAVCFFDEPAAKPSTVGFMHRDAQPRVVQQFSIPSVEPRGPPALHELQLV